MPGSPVDHDNVTPVVGPGPLPAGTGAATRSLTATGGLLSIAIMAGGPGTMPIGRLPQSRARTCVTVIAAEQTRESVPLNDFSFPHPLGIVLGHEQLGIDSQVLSLVNAVVEIPMFGAKHSHNVSTAAGIVLYEVRRQWQERGIATEE